MTGICFCLRPASFGYSPTPTARILWACSPEHAMTNEAIYGKENALSEQEATARQEAGKLAGEYLDYLNKTDLGDLSPDEFDTLLLTIIETYRDAMTKACEPF